jgi:restriction system protein
MPGQENWNWWTTTAFCIVGAVVGVRIATRSAKLKERADAERQRQRDIEYVQSGMAAIDQMNGIEFEQYVAARLRESGWSVTATRTVGDYGVDLITKADGRQIAVQCKRYGKAIGVSAVQQVVSGALYHGCTEMMVVSNQEFTKAAMELAQLHDCRLVGRGQLIGTPLLV